jgi:hypothetical protein
MFDPCGSLVGMLLLVVPPATICWTTAVAIVRYLRDRPVGVMQTLDAAVTCCWLQVMWLLLAFNLSFFVGGAAAIPLLVLAEIVDVFPLAVMVVVLAVGGAIGFVTWKAFWPILKEEWQRLTTSDASIDKTAFPAPMPADDEERT